MKKLLLAALAATMCFAAANAQNDERDKGSETKKGYNILPAEGDFALGVSANPFLTYTAGILSGGQAVPTFNGFSGRIYGKYFTRDNQAIRFGINLGLGGHTDKMKVADDSNTDPDAIDPHRFDKRTVSDNRVDIFAGYEWRRGYGRLQGVFGAQAGLDFLIQSTKYNWGNDMTVDRPTPTTTPWAGVGTNANRVVKVTGPGSFGFNVMGFVGAEFFFARKMSIGAELGAGFNLTTSGKVKTTSETVRNGSVERTKVVGNDGGQTNWGFNTILQGNLSLMFHF